MPYYDLKCNECNKLYEDVKLTYKEFDEHKCPECGGKTFRYWGGGDNMIGTIYKGGGWFKDGYSSRKPTPPSATKISD